MRIEFPYSANFAHTITSTYGARGTEWLEQLPTLVEQCAQQWQIIDLHPVKNLTYNYVLFGMQDGAPIVLKLRCTVADVHKEITALKAFEALGCVKVIAHDTKLGAILLERVMSGEALTLLFPQQDMQATHIAAKLLDTLHRVVVPSNQTFPLLAQVLPDLSKEPQALMPFLARARELKRQLFSTQQKSVLLHGDFHQGNILSASNERWVVIDPEGIIGDPIYDLAVYIRNPLQELVSTPHAREIIANRIHEFAQLLRYNAQRIADWVYVQAVCSAYWSIEDGLDVTHHVAFLSILNSLYKDSAGPLSKL